MTRWFIALAAGAALLGYALGRASAADRVPARTHLGAGQLAARVTDARPGPAPLPGVEVASPGATDQRRPVAEDARRAALSGSGVPGEPEGPLGELLAAWRAGRLRNPNRLVPLVAELHLDAGDPYTALDVLDRYESTASGTYGRIGEELLDAGDQALATRALTRSLELQPNDRAASRRLLELDPNGLLDALDRHEGAETSAMRYARIDALTKLGQHAEARRWIDETLEGAPDDQQALDRLAVLDPAAAEARFRRLAGEDLEWYCDLGELLASQGRADEAGDLILAEIGRSGFVDYDLRWELTDVDPLRGLELLRHTLSTGAVDADTADLWGFAGDELAEMGELEHAVDAWCNALATTPDDPDDWVELLAEHEPTRLLNALEARVRTAPDDEFWGALADTYWSAGRPDDAIAAWRTAAALDPEDDEWLHKLGAAADGDDPIE